MRIPSDAIIPEEKLTRYLLIFHDEDDKSKFLAQAGFTLDNPEVLNKALRELADTSDAIEDSVNKFGTFYRVKGDLIGPNEQILRVITIWLLSSSDEKFRFITLKPDKE